MNANAAWASKYAPDKMPEPKEKQTKNKTYEIQFFTVTTSRKSLGMTNVWTRNDHSAGKSMNMVMATYGPVTSADFIMEGDGNQRVKSVELLYSGKKSTRKNLKGSI